MQKNRCPVCHSSAETGRPGGRDALQVRCPRCGPFIVTGTATVMLPSRLSSDSRAIARTSHAIRSRTTEDNWLEIDSTNVDQITTQPLPPPDRQLHNLMAWMKDHAGDTPFLNIDISDRSVLAAITGSAGEEGFDRIIKWASDEGLIEITNGGNTASMTPKAWKDNRSTPLGRGDVPRKSGESTIAKGHCPKCGPGIKADVVAYHEERWEDDEVPIWTIDTFNILKCRGCETVYVQREHLFSEDGEYETDDATGEPHLVIHPRINYWPAPVRRNRPEWLRTLSDEALVGLLDEVYSALDGDQRVLAAVGARTALDRVMVLKGASESLNFGEKLSELEQSGVISKQEKDILLVLTDAGSAAAHRGWRPKPKTLDTIMEGVESFVHRALVLDEAVKQIKETVPVRSKKSNKSKTEKP